MPRPKFAHAFALPLASKEAKIRRAVCQNPSLSNPAIQHRLAVEGIQTTAHSIRTIRYRMRQEGIDVQPLQKIIPSYLKEAIQQAILEKPLASAAQILLSLASRGIRVSDDCVYRVRANMRAAGYDLPPVPRGPRPSPLPTLTLEQQKLLEGALPAIREVAQYELSKRPSMWHRFDDFMADLDWALRRWIVRYDPSKASLQAYLCTNTRFFVQQWLRDGLRQVLGITTQEATCIMHVIAGSRKGWSLEQTAAKYNMDPAEARQLYETYRGWVERVSYDKIAGWGAVQSLF